MKFYCDCDICKKEEEVAKRVKEDAIKAQLETMIDAGFFKDAATLAFENGVWAVHFVMTKAYDAGWIDSMKPMD